MNIKAPKVKKFNKPKAPNCWVCMDLGLVRFFKRKSNVEYEVFARCTCISAIKYSKKIKEVDEQVAEWAAKGNFEEWAEIHPEEAEKIIRKTKVS